MNVENGVEAMLLRRFPKLVITRDKDVVRGCDFLLHGSGPHRLAEHWPGPRRSLNVILRFAH